MTNSELIRKNSKKTDYSGREGLRQNVDIIRSNWKETQKNYDLGGLMDEISESTQSIGNRYNSLKGSAYTDGTSQKMQDESGYILSRIDKAKRYLNNSDYDEDTRNRFAKTLEEYSKYNNDVKSSLTYREDFAKNPSRLMDVANAVANEASQRTNWQTRPYWNASEEADYNGLTAAREAANPETYFNQTEALRRRNDLTPEQYQAELKKLESNYNSAKDSIALMKKSRDESYYGNMSIENLRKSIEESSKVISALEKQTHEDFFSSPVYEYSSEKVNKMNAQRRLEKEGVHIDNSEAIAAEQEKLNALNQYLQWKLINTDIRDVPKDLIPMKEKLDKDYQLALEMEEKEKAFNADWEKKSDIERFGDWLGTNLYRGLTSFNRQLASTGRTVLDTLNMNPEGSLADNIFDYYESVDNAEAIRQSFINNSTGPVGKAVGEIITGTVNAMPAAILAAMSGGTSLTGSAAMAGNATTMQLVGSGLRAAAQSPSFWLTTAQTLGPEYEDAIANGATKDQAIVAAFISTTLNALVEVGGGIEKLPTTNKGIVEWLKSTSEEGIEEVVQDLISQTNAMAIYDQNKELFSMSNENALINPVRSAQNYMGGLTVGAILGGGQVAIDKGRSKISEKIYEKTPTVEKYGKNEIAEISKQKGVTVAQNEKAFTAYVETSRNENSDPGELYLGKTNRKLNDGVKSVSGQTVESHSIVIDSSVASTVDKGKESVVYEAITKPDAVTVSNDGTLILVKKSDGETISVKMSVNSDTIDVESVKINVPVATKVNNIVKSTKTSKTGTMQYKGNTVEVASVESVEDGKMNLKLKDGTVVPATEIEYANEDQKILYASAAQMPTKGAAYTMISSYTEGTPVAEYVESFRNIEGYGYNGIEENVAMDTARKTVLTPAQALSAYTVGKNAYDAYVEESRTVQKNAAERNVAKEEGTKKGRVTYKFNNTKLSKKQRSAIEYVKLLSEITGINFELYESMVDSRGRRYGENGSYSAATNTIRLDIHSGNMSEQAVLRTLSHELTHYIKENNYKAYEQLQDYLLEKYRGLDEGAVARLVDIEKSKHKSAFGSELADDKALEEVVANSCEMMLKDSKAIQKLAEEDPTLFETFKEAIANIVDRLRRLSKSAFTNVKGSSAEYAVLNEVLDDFTEIQNIWDNALVGAVENAKHSESAEVDEENGNGKVETTQGTRYSIAEDRDGKKIVVIDTDQDLFAGKPTSEYSKIARKVINQKFKGKVLALSEYDLARVTNKSAGEYAYPRNINVGAEYDAKSKASTELDNLLKTAEFSYHSNDTKNHPEASLGWDYYKTRFVVGKIPFEGLINIATSEKGRAFYDITKIKKLSDIRGIRVTEMAQSASSFGELSDTRISQDNNGVNSSIRSNESNDTHSESNVRGNKPLYSLRDEEYLELAKDPEKNHTKLQEKGKQLLEDNDLMYQVRDLDDSLYTMRNNPRDAYYMDSSVYNYDNLVKQPNMNVVKIPDIKDIKNSNDWKISRDTVVSLGEKNASENATFVNDGKKYVKNVYTGINLRIDKSSIKHGLNGGANRLRTNGRLGAVIGDLVKNAIPINGLKNDSNSVIGTYAMVAFTKGTEANYVAIITVEQRSGNVENVDIVDVTHSVNGRINNIKKEDVSTKKGQGDRNNSAPLFTSSTISISNLLDIVKETHRSILSKDVLRHFNMEKPKDGYYSDRTLYQLRETSDRELLADALTSVAKTPEELDLLKSYKSNSARIDKLNAELSDVNAQIKEISFSKGKRDTTALANLRARKTKLEADISRFDKRLLQLEASKPIKDILTREKTAAVKKAKAEMKEISKEKVEQLNQKISDIKQHNREMNARKVESRRRTELKNKILKVKSNLDRMLMSPTDKNHIPRELISSVVGICEAITVETNSKSLKEKLSTAKAAYDAIKQSEDYLVSGIWDEIVSDDIQYAIDSIGNTPINQMSLSQLQDVYDVLKTVRKTVSNANKSFVQARGQSIAERAEAVRSELGDNKERKNSRHKATRNAKNYANSSYFEMLKPVYAFREINSDTLTEAYENVRKGEDVYAVDVAEGREIFLRLTKKYNITLNVLKKEHTLTTERGEKVTLSTNELMTLYALMKRQQAAPHLMTGGFVFEEEGRTNSAVQITTDDAMAFAKELTDDEAGFADEMQKYLAEDMAAKGNEVSRALYDVTKFKDPNYFPIKSASQYLVHEEKGKALSDRKIKNAGFTKDTVKNANNPVSISEFTKVWAGHVDEMSMYHAFTLPLEDFNRIFNYNRRGNAEEGISADSVKMAIESTSGRAAVNYVNTLIQDLNGGVRGVGSGQTIDKMVGLFKKGAVFASASVVIQQPSAIARSMVVLNPKYLISGAAQSTKARVSNEQMFREGKRTWEELKKYAPIARIKEMGYFDTGLGHPSAEWMTQFDYDGIWNKAAAMFKDGKYRDDVISSAPAIADQLTWCAIWNGCKAESKAMRYVEGTQAYYEQAAKRFTEVIEKTQVYDSVFSRAQIMRRKDGLTKMATAFMAEPLTSFNMLSDATKGALSGRLPKSYAVRAIGAFVSTTLLNSILKSLVTAARDDDNDKHYGEKYLGDLVGNFMDDINPLNMIPMARDVVSIFSGWDVKRTDMTLVTNLKEAIDALCSDKKTWDAKFEEMAGALAAFFGIPVKNVWRDMRAVYNVIIGWFNGVEFSGERAKEEILENFGYDTSDKAEYRRLYEATMDGDTEKYQAVRGLLSNKTDKQVESGVRSALVEYDERIAEAAKAKFDGDMSRYMELAKEVKADGFRQDTVIGAINNYMTKNLKPEDEESGELDEDDNGSFYKSSDVVSSLESNDVSEANMMITDILSFEKDKKGKDKKRSSIRSAVTKKFKPLYKLAKDSGNTAEMNRIKNMLIDLDLGYTSKTFSSWAK